MLANPYGHILRLSVFTYNVCTVRISVIHKQKFSTHGAPKKQTYMLSLQNDILIQMACHCYTPEHGTSEPRIPSPNEPHPCTTVTVSPMVFFSLW
ncbi:hypothetical protein AVEN_129225-1 [Araneus ventricosus]|uniref:Uncharacterized protein n=1 Tax=Araneus ventricosus TaxID=182803 RepID=A0A4Y2BLT2_ARAVE|nr:hypothetical protein AVEN_129225-1 [Araneus ventricosus]